LAKTQDRKEYKRNYYLANREKYLELAKEQYKNLTEEEKEARRDRQRERFLKVERESRKRDRIKRITRLYKLSPEDYFNMVQEQDNKCAICGCEERRKNKFGDTLPLSVDHNHTTGEVRRLLCNKCNTMLGYAREIPEILESAADYLRYFNDKQDKLDG